MAKKAATKSKTKTKKSKPSKKVSKGTDKIAAEMLRTPIVAVMGHVDHGKTTLLDTIRGANVAAGEVGGITQNTRAHKVNVSKRLGLKNQQHITFIDTPGHEAFSEMRSRGARVADMVILVVAADDGVQPQTKESIQFIKKAGIPVLIACNKIDAPGANVDKIKQELSANDILIEEYGGEAIFNEVSALKDEGIDALLESILLVAEVNELKAEKPAQGEAEGFVLESNLNSDLGPVGLVILKTGNIKRGQYIVSADDVHKIRATLNEEQKQTKKTEQGDPVWVIGLNEVLPVGENLIFFAEEDKAKDLLQRVREEREKDKKQKDEDISDHEMFAMLVAQKQQQEDTETTLKVIVRADTQGTLEAITNKLEKLKFDDARIEVFSAETGSVTESDVEMAYTIQGIILAFQVDVEEKAAKQARSRKVLIRTYQLIYEMLNEVEEVVNSMIEPEEEIEEVASADVRSVFTLSNGKQVAGCRVVEGTVTKGYKAYVERNGEEVADGRITSLKHLKEDVKEAKKGTECGIMLDPAAQFEEGDKIICYKVVS